MRIKDLDDNIVNWVITGDRVVANDIRKRSNLHVAAREILYELFPTLPILEEVTIPVRYGSSQYLDFYINNIKLAIEVHGQQHYKFNSLFHSTARDFLHQKKKDQDKREWCEQNNITCIELPYNEDIEQWKQRIKLR